MRNKIIASIVLVPLTAVVLTACGEVAAPVSHKADKSSKADDAPIVEDVAEAPDEDTEDTDAPEPIDETASLGDTVEVGDWSVTVTKVAKNADEAIHQANEFNERPRGHFVLVTYKATYTGAERTADVQWDTTWTFTDNTSKIHDTVSEVTQADNQEWPTEARKGGTVKQQVVFDIAPTEFQGGILSVEADDADYNTVFADFKVN